MNQPSITLYSLSTCSHCKSVKELLNRHGFKADVIDVDRLEGEQRKDVLEEIKKVNSRRSFPTLVVGEDVVVGFKSDQIKKVLEKNRLS